MLEYNFIYFINYCKYNGDTLPEKKTPCVIQRCIHARAR